MPPKKLTDLKVSPDNPREIQADRMAALVRSLREDPEMMQARPLLVRKDGTVIAGNMRLLAARELGWETIPTITVDLTDERARLWMLRDNNAYGEWEDEALAGLLLAMQEDGTDLELTGFGADEIDKLLASVGPHETDADPDAVPDVPEEAESKLGEVYELGRHRLMCGDATSAEDVAKLMGGGVCHCVFTSPPYALGVDYGSYVDDLEHLRVLLPSAVSVWTSLVVAGGYFVVNFSDVVAAQEIAGTDEPCEYPMAVEYWPVFRGAGWLLHTRRIWQKPHVRVHSPWAIKSSRAASDWEHLWTWRKPGKALTGRGAQSAFGVWDTSAESGVDVGKGVHGAGMPVALANRALQTHTFRDGTVVDPFGGTGTTLIAAERLGRTCCMMELEPKYCDVIRRRYAEYVGETDGDSKKKPATPPVG